MDRKRETWTIPVANRHQALPQHRQGGSRGTLISLCPHPMRPPQHGRAPFLPPLLAAVSPRDAPPQPVPAMLPAPLCCSGFSRGSCGSEGLVWPGPGQRRGAGSTQHPAQQVLTIFLPPLGLAWGEIPQEGQELWLAALPPSGTFLGRPANQEGPSMLCEVFLRRGFSGYCGGVCVSREVIGVIIWCSLCFAFIAWVGRTQLAMFLESLARGERHCIVCTAGPAGRRWAVRRR